jgi:dTDP-4-amino-4,6-dideoxygalactose transaminase
MVSREDACMIRLAAPEIHEQEIEAVVKVLRSGFLVQGEHVREFERQVAGYVGVREAVAVNSGTAALHLGLLALGIGPGDEVILPDFTFPATANVVELVGAKPVLVDIDLATFNIDPKLVVPAITQRTRAIMPVHLFGQPAELQPILEISRQYGLKVIEDAACALGAEYRGRKCGSFGDVGCFSFHPRKPITTGEGGMVVTEDQDLSNRLRCLRNHGMAEVGGRKQVELAGLNCRLTDFQGALGAVQMSRLDSIIKRRTELAQRYDRDLAEIASIARPVTLQGALHSWQSYVVRVSEDVDRDGLLSTLRRDGIEATIGTYALSAQPHYAGRKAAPPNSTEAYQRSLCLPLHPGMSLDDIDIVVGSLRRGLRQECS